MFKKNAGFRPSIIGDFTGCKIKLSLTSLPVTCISKTWLCSSEMQLNLILLGICSPVPLVQNKSSKYPVIIPRLSSLVSFYSPSSSYNILILLYTLLKDTYLQKNRVFFISIKELKLLCSLSPKNFLLNCKNKDVNEFKLAPNILLKEQVKKIFI